MFSAEKIRGDFPILKRRVNGKKLVYLDSAATSQKPRQVIGAVRDYYENSNSNVHRGINTLSEEATALYEGARQKIAKFVRAGDTGEIVFAKNASEAINLVARSWGEDNVWAGDKIVLTGMEHHSNLVPWQLLAQRKRARLEFVGITRDGRLDEGDFEKIGGAKLVCVTHASNVLGTINDVRKIARLAHDAGAAVLVDGAQSVPHFPVDAKKLDCDFLAFSGHKMLGPAGTGVLYARRELLEKMPPFLAGGDMISKVSPESAEWNELPWKFEAGTPNIEGFIGLGAAVDYLNRLGMASVRKHEEKITSLALERLSEIEGIEIYGPRSAKEKTGVVAFNLKGVHSHDVASALDAEGIAIRSGHHCAMPLSKALGISSSARASFYVYTTEAEIELLAKALEKCARVFA